MSENGFFLEKHSGKEDLGWTTGTCAAAASAACAAMIVKQEYIPLVFLTTPSGKKVALEIFDGHFSNNDATCSVIKFSGSDPDVTNGIKVFSHVEVSDNSCIEICGGEGIGIVSKAGLDQKVGEYAINSVPRKMIREAVRSEFMNKFPGAKITISIPEGKALAQRTFNPKLGILNGISVLGTSGLVKPMSQEAILQTIAVEMNVFTQSKEERLILVPGNYGKDFLFSEFGISLDKAVETSNFIYDSLVMAKEKGVKKILFCGHIGKLIKVAGGIKNTHSKYGDHRMEILWKAIRALFPQASLELEDKILSCISTDAALQILEEKCILKSVMKKICEEILLQMQVWTDFKIEIELIVFSNKFGLLGHL